MLRLKSGGACWIYGNQMKVEVKKSVLFDAENEIVRIERHQCFLPVEPNDSIIIFRIWTTEKKIETNHFESV